MRYRVICPVVQLPVGSSYIFFESNQSVIREVQVLSGSILNDVLLADSHLPNAEGANRNA